MGDPCRYRRYADRPQMSLRKAEAWLDHVRAQNVATFAPDVLPDSECRSIAKSCFRYWTRDYHILESVYHTMPEKGT